MPPVLPTATPKAKPLLITSVADAILQAVNRYHVVTAEQLCRLLYSAASITYVRSHTSHLADAGYLIRNKELRPMGPFVYSLGAKGRDYLASLDIAVPERLRQERPQQYHVAHLRHALGVTDVLVAADRVAKADARVRIASLLNEHALKRKGIRVTLPDGAKQTVCPDAWLDLRTQTDRWYRSCIAVEFDRGNEHQPAWREKVRAILAWAKGPYIQTFGTESLTVAVIVHAGPLSEQRCTSLVRWTEAELTAQGAKQQADLFCFTACDPATIAPEALFLSRSFAVPFDPAPTSLLTLPQGVA